MYPVASILDRAVAHHGSRLAVVDGDVRLNYRELGHRVDRLASALVGLGLEPGDRIAILDWNSQRYLEAYYACAKAGLAFMPLNSRLAPKELEYIFNDSDAKALMLSPPFLDTFESARDNAPSVEIVIGLGLEKTPAGYHDYDELISNARPIQAPVPVDVDDIVLIYYTSGTTGDPKGVCLTHRNMYFCGVDSVMTLKYEPGCVWLHSAPMFHLADSLSFFAVPMVGGAQVVVHFEPEKVLDLIQRERVTITSLPATLIAMIANMPGVEKYDLSSLKQIMYGGSPTPLGVLQKAAEMFSDDTFIHAYGITETAGLGCCLDSRDHTLHVPDGGIHRAASCGYPTPFLDVKAVDGDDNELPQGEVGEICFRGPKIMKEYWRKPEATAEALRGGWYHTGDVGYFDETGALFLVDRKKDMIITGAENVYSVEVENAISTHPGVLEVAVFGVPHEMWGEAVKAVVVPRDGHEVSEAEILDYCKDRIAGYKTPKSVDFVADPLPKTGPGKIAKRVLRDPYWTDHETQI